MTVHSALKRAREQVRTGWAEPFSLDERGAAGVLQKSAEKTSVADAVAWSSSTPEEAAACFDALERVACPNRAGFDLAFTEPLTPAKLEAARYFGQRYDGDLQTWLELPGRTLGEVLALFDRALVRTMRQN